MFSPGTWAHYTRTGGARVLARIIGDSPYGDEYRTIRYSRHSEDGQMLHIIDHGNGIGFWLWVLGQVSFGPADLSLPGPGRARD